MAYEYEKHEPSAKAKALFKKAHAGDESRRSEIERKNKAVKEAGLKMVAQERHERRHLGKKGTSKAEWREHIKQMSKDS